jgi:hypothetical protein
MHGRSTLNGLRTTASAVVLLMGLVACGTGGALAKERALSTHVLIGVKAGSSFSVLVAGQEIEGSPASSDEHGLLAFTFDDGDAPPGSITVSVAEGAALAVSDAAVDSVGETHALVAWSTNRPADSSVEYGEDEEYGDVVTDTILTTAHLIRLDDLSPGTLYHLRVVSDDGAVEAASGDLTFETLLPPLSLDGVLVENTGPTWAAIEWFTNRPATTRVDYGPTGEYGGVYQEGEFVTEHSATLPGLAEGALYHFSVTSIDDHDMVAVSGDSTFRTLVGEPTGPPALSGVQVSERSATSVVVVWTTDRPATSLVRFGEGGALDGSIPADTTLTTEHAVVAWPLVPRITYSFVAVSACGCDTASCAPVTWATELPPGLDADAKGVAVSRTVATAITDSTVVISWVADRPCSTWVDYGLDETYGASAPGRPLGGLLYEARLEPLLPGATYHYRVSAWDALGGEVSSEDALFEAGAPDEMPPAPPVGIETVVREGGVEIVWLENEEDDLAGYLVYRAQTRNGGADWERAVVLTPTPLQVARYFDASVEPGASYSYAVTAVDDAGNESGRSEPASADVPAAAPPKLVLAAYPNPTRDVTRIACSIPPEAAGAALRIVAPSGRVVFEIPGGALDPGEHTLTWDGSDGSGRPSADGVYLCELRAGENVARRKITLLR